MWGALIAKWLGSRKSSKKKLGELEETEDKDLSKKKKDEDNVFTGYLKSTRGYKTYKTGQGIGRILGLWK